jgi:hypothetical protein
MDMSQELIIQDFGGLNNDQMRTGGGTMARLMKGGSWKKQRIIVVLPADAMIPAKVALSHWNLIFPPNNGVVRILALGMEVGDAYSSAIAQVVTHPQLHDWEYLLTLEHDNLPPQDGVLKLIETLEAHPELAAVSGLYFTKGESGCAQIWGDPADPVLNYRPQVPKMDTVQECCGTGMGFALWRLSMFKDARIEKPWFKTEKGPGGVSTQDLAFWSKARKFGYRCAVDTRVRVGHIDAAGFVW